MADNAKLHCELWAALGSTDIPGSRHTPIADRLRSVPEHGAVPVRRNAAQSMEAVPAEVGLLLGPDWKRKVCIAGERGNLQRPPEHADTGGIDHDKRCAAADDRGRDPHVSGNGRNVPASTAGNIPIVLGS